MMTQTSTENRIPSATTGRAQELFREHQQSIFRHTDRMFAVLMVIQWFAGIAAAYWISPRTWIGSTSQTHLHVWAAVLLGGAISVLPISLALLRPGVSTTRYCIATGQMLMSALLIHLTGGRIETHFHVFGSLAFLSFYRDWRVLIPATIVVAADHFLRGVFWPQSVYGVITASEWRWLEHAGWVLFEDTFLFIAIRRSVSEMKDIALRTAEITDLNEGLERYVEDRTALLASTNSELQKQAADREKAQEELARQRAFLRQVIDLNPNLIFAKDRNGCFTLVNQAVAEVYGTSTEALLGKTDADFSSNHNESRRFREDDLEVMNTRRDKFIAEEVITDTAGNVRWLQTIKRPIVSPDGMANQILGVATDITARKQAEEALRRSEEQLRQSQKMESIGTLAGGVAHDFNNLLTTIIGNVQLAIAKLSPEGAMQQRLVDIEKAANKAAILTRQLLAFSRRQRLERKSLNLNDTISDIMKMLQRILGEDVEVRLQVTPNLQAVFADPAQIEQVIMNLVVNARDAMATGGLLTIETHNVVLDDNYCQAHSYSKPGEYVRIMVSDTGCGMSPDVRKHIFEPFFTTKEVGKGTGLGLAMTYGIVKQHEGFIEVYSESGKGTTFKIYLPVDQKVVMQESCEVQAPLRGGTETILLAEDEETLREVARDLLEDLGYQVLVAKDGAEAVEIFSSNKERINLLLFDVVMPRMGGHEAYNRIRDGGVRVPSIFVTGYSTEMAQSTMLKDRELVLIQKPYTIEVLGRKIRDVLDAA